MERSRFRMPAEWERQAATWVSWPHNAETWPDNLVQAQSEFVEFVKAIAVSQQVNVMAPAAEADAVGLVCARSGSNVKVTPIETNDAWARDYAPTFVIDSAASKVASVDWHYNAWGGKYPPFDADQKVAGRVADFLNIENIAGELCLEGGALEVNSQGVLVTTESCVLNPNRNPGVSKASAEEAFRQKLGCSKVVWLPGDIDGKPTIPGDDTDGHVDQVARFVSDDTMVHAWVQPDDLRYDSLKANIDVLKSQLPQVTLVPLMLPPEFELFDRKIPASYCNFLLTNEQVIVPQFGFPECDANACEKLTELLSNRRLIAMISRQLAVGLGSFHCLSQQQPYCNSPS